jgi:integrase
MKTVRHVLRDGTVREYKYLRTKTIARKAYPENSVGGVIELYEHSIDWLNKKVTTKINYRIYLRELERLRELPISGVSRSTLLAMRDIIAEKRGKGAATVFLRICSVILNFAVERERLPANPLAGMKKKIGGGHLKAWTPAQADEAERKLLEPLRRVVVLGRYTGMRRGDLIALRWSQVDINGGTVTFTPTKFKTGSSPEELVIPLHPKLRDELAAWQRNAKCAYVLTDRFGKPWVPTMLSNTMSREVGRIGLPEGLNVHGLRKLSLTALAEAGCSPHQIAAVSGHSTLEMIELYTRSVNQALLAREAFAALTKPKRKTAERWKKTA